jgi:hypothetical protein
MDLAEKCWLSVVSYYTYLWNKVLMYSSTVQKMCYRDDFFQKNSFLFFYFIYLLSYFV